MVLYPASGTGQFFKTSAKIIRLHRHGCTNRPFYHIVVTEVKSSPTYLGTATKISYILLASSTCFCYSFTRSCRVISNRQFELLCLKEAVIISLSIELYIIIVFFSFQRRRNQNHPVIEQVGSYDPMANESNEKLVSFNYERIRWWLGSGVHLTKPVSKLLG